MLARAGSLKSSLANSRASSFVASEAGPSEGMSPQIRTRNCISFISQGFVVKPSAANRTVAYGFGIVTSKLATLLGGTRPSGATTSLGVTDTPASFAPATIRIQYGSRFVIVTVPVQLLLPFDTEWSRGAAMTAESYVPSGDGVMSGIRAMQVLSGTVNVTGVIREEQFGSPALQSC